jgi:hypothetical protein
VRNGGRGRGGCVGVVGLVWVESMHSRFGNIKLEI